MIGLTIQITSSTSSGAVGRFWQITGETAGPAGQTTLTLLDPTEIPAYWTALPTSGSGWTLGNLSANFFVDEAKMVDAVTVWDDAATANLTLNGTSAGMYLTGFNTGGTFDYHNIESIEFFLGNNGNHLNVTGNLEPDTFSGTVLQTTTVFNMGDGNNNVAISLNNSVGGIFAVNLGNGTNTLNASASNVNGTAATAPLVIFGGTGTNTILGGQGGDTIIAHQGEVDYRNASGSLITSLGLTYAERLALDPTLTDLTVNQTDNLVHPATLITTRLDTAITGTDTITPGGGNNIILAKAGDSVINAGANGNNIVIAGYGQVTATAAGIITNIQSTSPNESTGDTITLGNGNNIVIGAGGGNTVSLGNGNNIVLGDDGTVSYNSSSGIITGIQTTNPTVGSNETITAGNGNNIIFGGVGNDTITTGGGNSTIIGHDGSIQYFTSGAPSLIQTADPQLAGSVTINAGSGNNIVFGGSGADTITTGNGSSIILGDSGSVTYQSPGVLGTVQTTNTGVGAADVITAGTGSNTIFGGAGNDNITAGLGGTGSNIIIGHDGLIQYFTTGTASLIETTDPQLAQNEQIRAGNGNNIIFGGSGADTIATGNGGSIIFGDNGQVTYQSPGVLGTVQTTNAGVGANDTITAGTGSNYIFGGTGSDNITAGLGGTGNNTIFGEDGSIQFFPAGSPSLAQSIDVQLASNNIINAGDGNNIIFGGSGSDTITAGNGSNIIFGDNGQVSYQSPGVLEHGPDDQFVDRQQRRHHRGQRQQLRPWRIREQHDHTGRHGNGRPRTYSRA